MRQLLHCNIHLFRIYFQVKLRGNHCGELYLRRAKRWQKHRPFSNRHRDCRLLDIFVAQQAQTAFVKIYAVDISWATVNFVIDGKINEVIFEEKCQKFQATNTRDVHSANIQFAVKKSHQSSSHLINHRLLSKEI